MDEKMKRIQKNNQYYDLFFENVKNRTENRNYTYLLERFLELLPSNTCILDIGCGTGEHLTYFKERGYHAFGIEPSFQMRRFCQSRNLTVIDGSFETLKQSITEIQQPIGGVWCAASLLHVPHEDFEITIELIYKIIEQGGVLFLTLRLGKGHKWDKFDDEYTNTERFIQLFEEKFLDNIIHRVGFSSKLKLIEESYWGRKTDWISYILIK